MSKMSQLTNNTKVLISGKKHPWHNESGKVMGAFMTVTNVQMVRVLMSNGMECGAEPKDLTVL